LAAVIQEEFGIEPQLVKGDNGVFDVVVEGRLVFSKFEAGRFPEDEEVLEALRGS
jgi:selT/selW/selH-like putative selenoprotein